MSELFFVVKVFLFSSLVMALMQIKIAERTIEQRSQVFLHSSRLVQTLNSVSISASRAIANAYHFVRGEVGAKLGSTDKASAKKSSANLLHGLDIQHEFHRFSSEVKSVLANKDSSTTTGDKEIKMVDESEL